MAKMTETKQNTNLFASMNQHKMYRIQFRWHGSMCAIDCDSARLSSSVASLVHTIRESHGVRGFVVLSRSVSVDANRHESDAKGKDARARAPARLTGQRA